MIPEGILIYILIGAALAILVLIAWIIRLEMKLKKFTEGKKAESLEDIIFGIVESVKNLEGRHEQERGHRASIEARLKKSIQGVGTIRFNPFKDSGGNQSFATAFLNEHGDGVVLSSLFSRERMSVFAKPVQKLKSPYELTKEEAEAISAAAGENENDAGRIS